MAAEKLVSVRSVKQAIVKLQSQGDRPSNRNIRRVLGGGSPNDIQSILQQISDSESAGVDLLTVLPEEFQNVMLNGINCLITEVTSNIQGQLQQIRAERAEVLDELEQSLQSNSDMKSEFDKLSDSYKLELHRVRALETQVADLKMERQQLVESGEVARTASAKAQLQVERADRAAEKCEARVLELEKKLDQERELRHAAEVRAASAEARTMAAASSSVD